MHRFGYTCVHMGRETGGQLSPLSASRPQPPLGQGLSLAFDLLIRLDYMASELQDFYYLHPLGITITHHYAGMLNTFFTNFGNQAQILSLKVKDFID